MHRCHCQNYPKLFVLIVVLTTIYLNQLFWFYVLYPAPSSYQRFQETNYNESTICARLRNCDYKNTNQSLDDVWSNRIQFTVDRQRALILGKPKTDFDLMTIGISTVNRTDGYLSRTLWSMIIMSSPQERLGVTVILLLADFDLIVKSQRLAGLRQEFGSYFEEGFLQVIEAPLNFYPTLDGLRQTFDDSDERVRWRAKQTVDFAFLFLYAHQMAHYHLILEDDVLCSRHYLTAIKDFLGFHENHSWLRIEFTGFPIIGHAYRSSALSRMAGFLLTFYADQPVDLLLDYFIRLQVPTKDDILRRIPSVFQHIGLHSTLRNKIQNLTDESYGNLNSRRFQPDNPPANIVTTIKQYSQYLPWMAYSLAPGFFWGMPVKDDTFDIIFDRKQNISRIVVSTGLPNDMQNDFLESGVLQVSSQFKRYVSPNKASCIGFKTIAMFLKGEAEYDEPVLKGVKCLRILVSDDQILWIAVNEIAVFTNKTM